MVKYSSGELLVYCPQPKVRFHLVKRESGMPTDALRGKVVMVTGANSGMGKEISLALAAIGATVVMVSRDPSAAKPREWMYRRKRGTLRSS